MSFPLREFIMKKNAVHDEAVIGKSNISVQMF